MTLKYRNAMIQAKIQSTPGTPESLNASADAIRVSNPQINLSPQNTETDEVGGSLSRPAPIVGGTQVTISFAAYLRGNGVPGTAPQWGKLLRACGFGEVATSTALTGTTYSITGGNTLNDSSSGLASFTVGTVFHFVSPLNNAECRVSTSAAGALLLTKPDGSPISLTNESAGGSFTIKRGQAAAAAAAGSTTQFTAGSGWSASAQAYRGMPVLIGGNPSTPDWATIIDYTTGKVASLGDTFASALTSSSLPSIPANVLYKLISTGIPVLTMSLHIDGLKWVISDAVGTVNFTAETARTGLVNFTFSGLFVSESDEPVPTGAVYDLSVPGTFRDSSMKMNRKRAAVQSLSIDLGNQVVYPGDPNELEGFAAPEIVGRNVNGTADPTATLKATRDFQSLFRAGVADPIIARIEGGAAAPGNRVAITVPAAIYTGYAPVNRNGFLVQQMQFNCTGEDAEVFVCVY